MPLAEIRSAASKFAHTISQILDVDVLIVDDKLKSIGSTFRYFESYRVVRSHSVVATVMSTGEPVAIANRQKAPGCQTCPDAQTCEMRGIIAVPIRYKRTVVGAIGLIIPRDRVAAIFRDVDNSVAFAQDMAALLASKIQDKEGYSALDVIKREREILMDEMDCAIVATDHAGKITYYNRQFGDGFCDVISPIGSLLWDLIPHKVVSDYFLHQTCVTNQLVYTRTEGTPFYGFLTCKPIAIKGRETGALFIFKPVDQIQPSLGDETLPDLGRVPLPEDSPTFPSAIMAEMRRLAVREDGVLIHSPFPQEDRLVARYLHNYSSRSHAPLIVVECGQFTDLWADPIFGEVGQLHLAHRGTLLFRDVECLPHFLQDRLQAFLETGTLPYASDTPVRLDVRVLCSTSVDLAEQVEAGNFSRALYHLISAYGVTVPPIAQDPTQLRALIQQFLRFYKYTYGKEQVVLSADVVKHLCGYHWPGNVPQLSRTLDNLVYGAQGLVSLEELHRICPILFQTSTPTRQEGERVQIAKLLEEGHTKESIAVQLGISRATLYRKLKQYQF